MNSKRIGRVLVCLLLICCLTFHAMIPRAEASSIGAAATIVKASTVTCNPYIIAGATLIALGVYAGVDSGAFETVANNCVDALEAAGTWIKDGVTELLRTEDADGNASYYVDSGLMEDVRSFLFESGIVSSGAPSFISSSEFIFNQYNFLASNYPYCVTWLYDSKVYFAYSDVLLIPTSFQLDTYIERNDRLKFYSFYVPIGSTSQSVISTIDKVNYFSSSLHWFGSGYPVFSSNYDLSLGTLPAQSSDLTDGTSARQWSEDYTDRGLKVYGGGSGNNNNDGKWFWKLMIPVVAADLLAMSQADEWSGETPKEFDDYTEVEELEIVSRPEVDFAQGVELAPVTSPAPDTGGNTGSDTGDDTEENPEVQTDYTTWFQKLYTSVENIAGKFGEIPNKFQSWINDCKTAIEELPSKFADWFNNINSKLERLGEHLQTIGESIVNGVSTLGEKILSLGQIIIEGVQNAISALFTPSPDYFTNKVEALKAKHHNIEKFTQLGNDFKLFFTGLGSKPPIIWIDLGAATGSYLWGGKQIFLDLTWYSQYKSKMDFILGAIIWLWLAWRVFLSVPGIINGASGVWGKYHRGGSRDDN